VQFVSIQAKTFTDWEPKKMNQIYFFKNLSISPSGSIKFRKICFIQQRKVTKKKASDTLQKQEKSTFY
jgi:hypothetical protein